MSTSTADNASRILWARVEAVAGLWLVSLPLLRPLVWSGQPTDVPNLFFLVLLAAAITTGLLLRGLEAPIVTPRESWWRRPSLWGVAFLAVAAGGSLWSPLPAAAWTLTIGWALHLAAPWALWPAIRRRPHLVVAGLVAGLVGEACLLVGQVCCERPHLAAQLANDPALTVEQRIAEQYAVRIGSWRLEGTFLLANTLATYLLLLIPLMIGIAWRVRTRPVITRLIGIVLSVMAVGALIVTGSKAGMLAGVVAAVVLVVVAGRSWRWRAVTLSCATVLVGIALLIPGVRQAMAGSAGVRLDYWSAGLALVAERPLTGHGLEGFAVHYPRVKPPAGEETIIAHQETLQAAVDLGVPAMLILLGWWLLVLWSMRPAANLARSDTSVTVHRPDLMLVIGLPALLLFGFLAAGILHANLATYPGSLPGVWAVAFTVVLVAIALLASRLPSPPPIACCGAVLACLLHVQADFSLHSMQVVGVLAWVAMLGRALVQPAPSEVVIAGASRQGWFAAAGLGILALITVGIMVSSTRGEILERARGIEAIFARLRLIDNGRLDESQRGMVIESFERAYARAVIEHREAAVTSDPREGLALITIRQAIDASRRFPADHDLAFVAVAIGEHVQALLPKRAELLTPLLEDLLAAWPQDLLVTKALGEHYLRLARAATGERRQLLGRQAQTLAQRAVELYPTHLPLRQTVIQAAEITGDQATIAAQRAEIARLEPLVHRDNRTR